MSWSITWDGRGYHMPKRDSQRQRVYDAEHLCFGAHREARQFRNLTSDQLQVLTDGLWESDRVQSLLRKAVRSPGQKAPRIIYTRHSNWARGCQSYIKLPPWALNLHTWLHEIAHAITPGLAKHSWMFCAVMLELVEEFMGPKWASLLRLSYDAHKVGYVPNKRHLAKQSFRVAADRV